MKKNNMQGLKRSAGSKKRIIYAVLLALILFGAIGCRGGHRGGHDDGLDDRSGGHGCRSQFAKYIADII